jgi:HlyD family secretion protein
VDEMKKIIGIIFIICIAIGGYYYIANQDKVVEVEVMTVERGHIVEYVEEVGVVVSENKGQVFAPTAGRVTQVLVGFGDFIEEGQVIARIDSQQLSRQIMELEAQKSALFAEYSEAVKPIDNREIEKLELQLEIQNKNVEEATRIRDLNKSLYESDIISYEEYHTSVKALDLELAKVEQIELDLELINKPISENIESMYQAQFKQIDLQIDNLRNQGQDFVVTSPHKGTIISKHVEVGSYMQPGTPMIEVSDQENLYIETDLLVSEIGKVQIGSEVELYHEDLGIDGVKGIVRKIHPQAFSKLSDLGLEQKRITVEIEMDARIEGLRPGYDLEVKIVVNRQENVVLIPEKAIFEKEQKQYVFVNDNNIAVLREIETGLESSRQVEVISGLEAGEILIVSPDENLEEGIMVR